MTTFSETHGTRRAFIGEHTEWMKDPDAWKRDTLVIEAQYGSIRLNFASDDAQRENEDGIEKGVGGFFSKLFG